MRRSRRSGRIVPEAYSTAEIIALVEEWAREEKYGELILLWEKGKVVLRKLHETQKPGKGGEGNGKG